MCNKEHLVGYLYDELAQADRLAFEAHVRDCPDCRAELSQLRQTRHHLETWSPPDPEFTFRVVREPVAAPRRRVGFVPRWALAAAASVLLAAGALAIAQLEVRRTSDGFVVRTGWGRQPAAAAAVAQAPSAASGVVQTAAADRSSDQLKAVVAALQQRLDALEQAQPAKASSTARPGISTAELRQILAAMESRQRAETALQIRQVWSDFSTARQNDFVRVQQTLNQQQGFTNAQLRQQRDSIEYLRSVSQQK